jgi:periplasmic protein TonB
MEKKSCIACGRAIDTGSRICPFCNWEQDAAPPVRTDRTEAAPAPAAPAGRKRAAGAPMIPKVLLIAAVAVVLIATFAVGGLVYSFGKRAEHRRMPTEVPSVAEDRPVDIRDNIPDVKLVPEGQVGRAITSLPAAQPDAQLPPELQRSDATAIPSEEYARILESHQQAPPATGTSAAADPRTIQARPAAPVPVPAPPPRQQTRQEAPAPSPEPVRRTSVNRTRPKPISQPLPDPDRLRRGGRVRLNLTIGANGRVTGINVLQTAPGITDQVVASVQRWRFEPAKENGVPVEGEFLVDISFNAND